MRDDGWLPPGPGGGVPLWRGQKEMLVLPPGPGGGVPLWRGQKEMLVLATGRPEASLAYNETVALDLRGPLDESALERALARVLSRHEALRIERIDGETWEAAPTSSARRLTLEDIGN